MVNLQRTPEGWAFLSEAALEAFIWENLKSLFDVTPLARQHFCNGEVCDILAVGEDRALVILELKNVEDRYLIQQLTRYYANLIEQKPFREQVDYGLPVRLVAIAPTYHRHNLIDRQYSILRFDLWRFEVVEESPNPLFQMKSLDSEAEQTLEIVYTPPVVNLEVEVPEPPTVLLQWLGGCTPAEQEGILRLRGKLLAASPRIKEMVGRNKIQYGSGTSKLCAELIFQTSKQRPVLFLWLPTPSSTFHGRKVNGRLRIWTNDTGITHVGHVPEGLGRMQTKEEWMRVPEESRPKSFREGITFKSYTPLVVETYLKSLAGDPNVAQPDSWSFFAEAAIETWRQRG